MRWYTVRWSRLKPVVLIALAIWIGYIAYSIVAPDRYVYVPYPVGASHMLSARADYRLWLRDRLKATQLRSRVKIGSTRDQYEASVNLLIDDDVLMQFILAYQEIGYNLTGEFCRAAPPNAAIHRVEVRWYRRMRGQVALLMVTRGECGRTMRAYYAPWMELSYWLPEEAPQETP